MKNLSLIMIATSIMLTISSSNLMLTWAFLEINSISFISFMEKKKETENMLKYFLIQMLGSIPFIMSIVLNHFFLMSLSMESILIMISMMIKMGAAPFHMWIIQMSKKMTSTPFFILLSIQKIAPISILGLILKPYFMMWAIFISSMIGAMSIFSSNNLKLIIIFSSISHLSWIFAGEMTSKKSSMFYLMIYSSIILIIILTLKKDKIDSINMQEKMNKNSPLITSILSLGGVPPTVGFFPKMMLIFMLMKSLKKTLSIFLFLLLSSIISIIAYLRLLMKTTSKSKKKSKFKNPKNSFFLNKTQIVFMPMLVMLMPM